MTQPLTDREFRLFVEAAYWLDALSGECHHAPQVPLSKSIEQITEENRLLKKF